MALVRLIFGTQFSQRQEQITLEIRFRKNLAKLKGSAVRIKSKKPKGKKTMKEKKNGGCQAGI